jgi:predicted RNA binding protein YcfA (HicA-like mRNA interferase family)
MRLPRDLSGDDLAKALERLGYKTTRQTGSHMRMRLTTAELGEHHITIPRTDSLRIGTLSGILANVATHFGLTREELIKKIF